MSFCLQCKAKSQLRIAGLSTKMYWLTICAVDWLQFMTVGVFMILCFYLFNVSSVFPRNLYLQVSGFSQLIGAVTAVLVLYIPYPGFRVKHEGSLFQLRALTEPGAMLAIILFLLLYIPIYMLALYIISYAFNVAYTSQGLIQTLIILVSFTKI